MAKRDIFEKTHCVQDYGAANNCARHSYKLAEQQPVGRWVELKQEPVSPSSD